MRSKFLIPLIAFALFAIGFTFPAKASEIDTSSLVSDIESFNSESSDLISEIEDFHSEVSKDLEENSIDVTSSFPSSSSSEISSESSYIELDYLKSIDNTNGGILSSVWLIFGGIVVLVFCVVAKGKP